jgi:hypothetical protein
MAVVVIAGVLASGAWSGSVQPVAAALATARSVAGKSATETVTVTDSGDRTYDGTGWTLDRPRRWHGAIRADIARAPSGGGRGISGRPRSGRGCSSRQSLCAGGAHGVAVDNHARSSRSPVLQATLTPTSPPATRYEWQVKRRNATKWTTFA